MLMHRPTCEHMYANTHLKLIFILSSFDIFTSTNVPIIGVFLRCQIHFQLNTTWKMRQMPLYSTPHFVKGLVGLLHVADLDICLCVALSLCSWWIGCQLRHTVTLVVVWLWKFIITDPFLLDQLQGQIWHRVSFKYMIVLCFWNKYGSPSCRTNHHLVWSVFVLRRVDHMCFISQSTLKEFLYVGALAVV